MAKTNTLSSGLVIAGAYADKIRRTLFAQMKDYVKADKSWAQRVAYAAAQLNRFLYTILVEELKIDKGDVVRVRIEYEIDEANKEIKWKWDTLQLEVFRRVPEEQIRNVLSKVLKSVEEIAAVEFDIVEAGKTIEGDNIYKIMLGDELVGAAKVMQVDGKEFVSILVMEIPEPIVARKVSMPLRDAVRNIGTLPSVERVAPEEAKKLIEKLLSLVGSA